MPVFNDPKVEAAAQGLVMVKQNQDHRPEWLRQFSELGGYVPRVFFFGVDGELRRDITSGNSRYPYYYTQGGVDSLLRSMKKAGAK
jgi:hypothetical protein